METENKIYKEVYACIYEFIGITNIMSVMKHTCNMLKTSYSIINRRRNYSGKLLNIDAQRRISTDRRVYS